MTRPTICGLAICLAAALATLAPPLRAQINTLTKEQMIEYTAQNPFERFPDGRPRCPMRSSSAPAKGLSAEEVFGVLPGKGFRNQYEDGFQVLHPGKKMVGRAFTVQFMPARPDVEAVMNAKAREKGGGG
jgi:4-hydroxy-4-methyl-2-oxoglutarate aldolase